MTDCEMVLSYLQRHIEEWCNVIDIMTELKPNSRNWAIRSRVSNLRQKGYTIESRIGNNRCAEYMLKPCKTAQNGTSRQNGTDVSPKWQESEAIAEKVAYPQGISGDSEQLEML